MLTQKQITSRKVFQSLYLPLELAERVDGIAENNGMSRNEFISKLIVAGLSDDKILNTVVKGFTVSHQQTPAPVVEEPELTFSERSQP